LISASKFNPSASTTSCGIGGSACSSASSRFSSAASCSASPGSMKPKRPRRWGAGPVKKRSMNSDVLSSRPSPGPTSNAWYGPSSRRTTSAASAVNTPRSCGSSRNVASGKRPDKAACSGSDTPSVTRPAPTRYAPSPASAAAPVYISDPATISTRPKVSLCASAGRGGSNPRTQVDVISSRSTASTLLRLSGRPIGTTTNSPQAGTPAPRNMPRFGKPIVTVRSAPSISRRRAVSIRPTGNRPPPISVSGSGAR
jgi:hypothetical protein